ncbi:MAG TPA: DUF4157 domain-containing protein [Kofleriaceae bacterium]|nr:DUF4157 domain-containing protein [Kofleriaceae bacterium]
MTGTALRDTAAAGVEGSGSQLPFLSLVQKSFGPDHDVSAIRAHVGGRAGAAARDIGADAYATGNAVAFAGAPDLHTAAHEAAHVIQQQAGVQLKGGIGEQGDAYEREADAVADAVVAGRSAAPLLARYVGGAGGSGGVQMKKQAVERAPVIEEATLLEVSGQLETLLRTRESRPYFGKYAHALLYLEWAVLEDGPVAYTAENRLAFLDTALGMLRPVLSTMKADQRWVSWLYSAGVERSLASVRTRLHEQRVEDRIATASLTRAEEPDAPKSEAQELKSAIAEHIKTTAKLTSIVNGFVKESEINTRQGKNTNEVLTGKGALGLEAMNDTLGVVSGYLDLTDEDLQKRYSELAGLPGLTHAKTRLEVYKATAGLLESAVGARSKLARLVALQVGKPDLAAKLANVSDWKAPGRIVAAVTFMHSVAVLCDERSTDQERLDAVFDAAGASLSAAGLGTASFLLGTTYLVAKAAASLYWQVRGGITKAYTDAAFATITRESASLVRRLETMVITAGLLATEHDPDQRAALEKREKGEAAALGGQIDHFLAQSTRAVMERQAGGPSLASYPGNHRTLREMFQPLATLQGKSEPTEAVVAATTVVETINECLRDAELIFAAETANGGVDKLGELRTDQNRKNEEQRQDELRLAEELAESSSSEEDYADDSTT